MSAHKGFKAKLLQAMQGGQLVSIAQAAELLGESRKKAAQILRAGEKRKAWKSAGPRHATGDDRGSQRRFGLDDDALHAYASATEQPRPESLDGARLNRRIGAILGAIKNLDGIKARCDVNEDTDCWLWRFSVAGSAKVPHGHFNGRNLSMVRTAYRFHTRRPVPAVMIVWRTCCSKLCLNPQHMRQGTRAQHGQWVAEQGHMRGNIGRINACRAAAVSRTTVTADIARQIMASDKPHAEWARELGVTTQTVKRALVRRTEGGANSSVFTWRPAA